MSNRKKILIIDDEIDFVEMVQLRLQYLGFEVEAAFDGDEGLMMVESFKPDLILLDLAMPGKDGWEVFQCLKSKDQSKNIPVVIILAALVTDDMVSRAEALGVNQLLLKPFQGNELLETINKYLEN